MTLRIDQELAVRGTDVDHLNVVVRTTVRARGASDARVVVDQDIARFRITSNRTSGATDHTNRVHAVHAGSSHHLIAQLVAFANKSRIVVVSHRAGSNADTNANARL